MVGTARKRAPLPTLRFLLHKPTGFQSEHLPKLAHPHPDSTDTDDHAEEPEGNPPDHLVWYEPEAAEAAAELAFAGTEGDPIEAQREAADQQRCQRISPLVVSGRQADENSAEYEYQPGRHAHPIVRYKWSGMDRAINGRSRDLQTDRGKDKPKSERSTARIRR